MAQIAVVYHSGYGHTQRLAQVVAQGAGARITEQFAHAVWVVQHSKFQPKFVPTGKNPFQ